MGSCAYSYFYGNEGDVRAEIEDIEDVILNGGIDPDGISGCMWIKELASQDLPGVLFRIIIENKKNPAFKELYQEIIWQIEGITDKDMWQS